MTATALNKSRPLDGDNHRALDIQATPKITMYLSSIETVSFKNYLLVLYPDYFPRSKNPALVAGHEIMSCILHCEPHACISVVRRNEAAFDPAADPRRSAPLDCTP